MLVNSPHLGEILALSCAILWATAVILFRKSGETVAPSGLNLFKNTLALALFVLTSLVLRASLFPQASAGDYFLVLASGIIGLSISDTLFFRSLNLLGAELSAIVDCLYSPFIIGLSVLLISESMSALQVLGVFLIVSAVLAVSGIGDRKHISRHDLTLGILLGVLAMATMAVGIVMIKPLLNRSPLLWVVEVRLFAGCVGLSVYLLFHPRRGQIVGSLMSVRNWQYMLPGSFLGAYLSMIVWMGGMKYTQASIASALNQTSNVFVFILAALLLKEPVNLIRVIAIILAFSGAFIVSFG
ncbi:MAG: EamA family transporter [candidate division Zixibacteria bacterium]|nr:EamA family transporter [candidate division Zixibacteria bacterium]